MKLKMFQVRGRDFLIRQSRALVVLPTGTGKTLITLLALQKLPAPHVIFCSKSLVGQWLDALKSYGLERQSTVITFPEVQHHPKEAKRMFLSKGRPEVVVVDEPKPLKSETIVFQHFLTYKLRAPRRILLDATPVENSLEELWYLFRWLCPKVLGKFEDYYPRFIASKRHAKNLKELRALIKPHVYSPKVQAPREREVKFLTVVPNYRGEILVEHDLLCRELARALKANSVGQTIYKLNRARGLISRLRSFLSDPLRGASPKLEALKTLIQKTPGKRGIICVYKRDTAKAIKEVLTGANIAAEIYDGGLTSKRREKLRQEFNEGSLQFLVATSAAERGVDLPTGDMVVHFDLPWTRASFDQRDRVSRLSSSRESSLIVTLLMRGTVDEVMWSIIAAKQKLMVVPFEGDDDEVIIPQRSWGMFLNKYLEVEYGTPNEETGENIWFSRGKKAYRKEG